MPHSPLIEPARKQLEAGICELERDAEAGRYNTLCIRALAGAAQALSQHDVVERAINLADYDLQPPIAQVRAQRAVQTAEQVLQVLDGAALEPTRTQITDAMKAYERDVLQNVTWQP